MRSNSGFSLVEVMIGVAIMVTGFTAMFSMMDAQMRGQKYIMQKYESQELAAQLKARLPLGNFCKCSFAGTHNFSTPLLERVFNRIFGIRNPTAPTDCAGAEDLIPTGGEIPSSSGLKVSSIKLKNLIPSATPNNANVDLEVIFNHETGLTPIKPILMAGIPVITSGPLNALTIESCTGSGGGPLPDAQAICTMLGFAYDATQNPPCTILGSTAANQICRAMRGTPVTMVDGTPGCRVLLSIPGATQPGGFPCIVPMASNLRETTIMVAGWLDKKVFDKYPALQERIISALSKFTGEASASDQIAAIYGLAGVSSADHREVVAFLKTESFARSHFTDRLVAETGMERNDAAQFLSDIAGGMRGSLN